MTRHDRLDDAARDRAALHALGSLSREEASEYERHLAECEACRSEVRSLREVLDGLVHLAPAVAPPPELKARLMASVRAEGRGHAQTWKTWRPDAEGRGLTLIGAGEGGFEPAGVAGVEVRRLHLDVESDRVTMLIRMAPGTSYPAHRHSGAEECYVLEGDLLVGEYRMRAGDYQRVEAGSIHGIQSTERGCLLFIVSSLHDELLDSRNA